MASELRYDATDLDLVMWAILQGCSMVVPLGEDFPHWTLVFLTTASSNQLTKVRNKVELAYLFLHKADAIVQYVLVYEGAKVCQHSLPKLC